MRWLSNTVKRMVEPPSTGRLNHPCQGQSEQSKEASNISTLSQTIDAPVGGVMTNEVGAVTGRLTLRMKGGKVQVAYEGADEWYTVEGRSSGDLKVDAARLATDPGTDKSGNARSSSLED